ncbi:MAG: serine/threonine-protein phosphatase [Ruminococcus sp.]|nr:serine/threonine-protein phosphatase [Ruminococcus sp.]
MEYAVKYAVGCHQGKVREKNQDNFWVKGQFLKSENKGLDKTVSGESLLKDSPAFCVFDGVGGECSGEIASYLAAEHFDEQYNSWDKLDPERFMLEGCKNMSKKICDFSRTKGKGVMGTTAAMVLFADNTAFICNVGDSPVFVYNEEGLEKVSTDHVGYAPEGMKPPITQSLGIPEDRLPLAPSIFRLPIDTEDTFLVCSDGLTDMVDPEVIIDILEGRASLKRKVKKLIRTALKNGGKDNITVILCRVA